MADLTRPVYINSGFVLQLNDAAVADGIIVGTAIDSLEYDELDSRQVMEPFVRAAGIDVGGVWVTARHIRLTGTVYGATFVDAWGVRSSLESAFRPSAGIYAIVFYVPTVDTGINKVTIPCLSEGMRFLDERHTTPGSPAALQFSASLIGGTPVYVPV